MKPTKTLTDCLFCHTQLWPPCFPRSLYKYPRSINLSRPTLQSGIEILEGLEEGTGTWPDYLVNRDVQKNEGPLGEKNCTEIEK